MDKSIEKDRSHRENKDKAHFVSRNINSAPALVSVSVLDAVLEEDENIAHKDLLDTSEVDTAAYDATALKAQPLASGLKQNSDIEILSSQKPEKLSKSPTPEHFSNDPLHKAIIRESEILQESTVGSDLINSHHCDPVDPHHQDRRSSNDMLYYVDVISDKEWDTDLETEDPPVVYDHTGKTAYLDACIKYKVAPVTYFLRHINDNHLSMKHHDLTGDEMKAVAASLAINTTITMLDLSDNWLGHEAGLAICEALRENCFITDLNLSDNHLNLCTEQLCHILKQNSTLHRVNISGNGFDDHCAGYLSDLIMNSTQLEYLNLSHNSLGERAGLLLGPAISENLCLKELDLSWNQLRRSGAVAVIAGIKNNVYMKKVNLSWNGFGREGCIALKDALKTNSVLEEIDLTNNRITTEGAVLIGKGLLTNEALKVFKIGKNPIQSSGCWGIASAILRNPGCILKTLDFTDIPINKDFVDLWKQVEEQFPNIKVVHGGYSNSFPRASSKMYNFKEPNTPKLLHKESNIKAYTTLRPVTS